MTDKIIVDNCECEHVSHFDKATPTPNGNPAHKYGQQYHNLKPVKTPYGTFHLCIDCRMDCEKGSE